ncbi:hypothetical protein [Brooklawnia sp.]|uniref:hypothetical protein n=1 Tax=Brooklawnia sp. TaxID=2699740 RepID=UPI00311DFE92
MTSDNNETAPADPHDPVDEPDPDDHDPQADSDPRVAHGARYPKRRTIIWIAVVALIMALIAGIAVRQYLRTPPDPVPATVPVAISGLSLPKDAKLGIVVTLGDGAPSGSEWNQAAQGARVAQQRLSMGGAHLELIVENDHGTSDGARDAISRLAGQGVAGIILATDGPQLADALTSAQDAGVPVLLPYSSLSADAASVDGVWSLVPDTQGTAAAYAALLQTSSHPLLIDAGPGLPEITGLADAVPVSDGADLSALAADVAHRTNADASAGGAYSGDPDKEQSAPVEDPNDLLVISGRPVTQAMIVRALQAKEISVPIVLAPGATSPAFATRLSEQGGSASTNLVTVGAPWSDSVALSNDPHGRAMSAFLAGVRLSAENREILDLTEETPFADVAAAADVRSHDAVIALARAVSEAGSTKPSEVSKRLARLRLNPADGIGGPDLDFSHAQAFAGEATTLHASDQWLGLRPGTGSGQLVWFAAPGAA